jgi:putative membrane protein
MTHKNYFFLLLALFTPVAIWAAINPSHPADWALENVLVAVALVGLIVTLGKFPLSRVSYTLIFLFLILHEVGSHYTYAEVPYDAWFKSLTGNTLNSVLGFERNHYDRLVHFSYGLLFAYPIREVFIRIANVKGFWSYFFPLDLTMSTSMIYELVEWGAAEAVGGDLGAAYLGSQGDIWDAHKDMGLASIGALITMLLVMFINIRLQRDFAQEWNDSLTIQHPEPLGEDEISRMVNK